MSKEPIPVIFKLCWLDICLPSCSSIINQSAFSSNAKAIAEDSPSSNLIYFMATKVPDAIQSQLLQIFSRLSLSEQEQVLELALTLHRKQQFQHWHTISNEEAAALKAEFADEDLAYSEAVLTDYLHQLQTEDIV